MGMSMMIVCKWLAFAPVVDTAGLCCGILAVSL